MNPIYFKTACILIALGISFGAFGAHYITQKVAAKDLAIWETAVFYHLVNSIGLLVINCSSLVSSWVASSSLKTVNMALLVGILVFSGSLYLLVLTNQRWLGAITPIGGLSLIGAWIILALSAKV